MFISEQRNFISNINFTLITRKSITVENNKIKINKF